MSHLEMLGVFTPGQKAVIKGWWKKVTAAHPSARNFKDMRVPTVGNIILAINFFFFKKKKYLVF